jgi:hypothetical protein
MSHDMVSLISELKNLSIEIQNRSKEIAKLRKRKETIEASILKYLNDEQKPGIKHGGTVLITEEKTGRTRKKKEEKTKDCIDVLKHYGISNANKIYTELLEAFKGTESTKKILKIQKT